MYSPLLWKRAGFIRRLYYELVQKNGCAQFDCFGKIVIFLVFREKKEYGKGVTKRQRMTKLIV